MKATIAIAIIAAAGSAASAAITINEVLGSTSGADSEFIELYNSGPTAIDLSGWSIEIYDSDAGPSFGGLDGGSPYVINTGTIDAGGHFLMINANGASTYGVGGDYALPANAIENSSYTLVLRDAMANIIETIFVTDGGDGDVANIAGTVITPDYSFGPDGTFLPAGFYRIGDGSANLGLLEFGQPSPSATPGYANIPSPAVFAVMGLGGLVAARRRR